MSGKLEGQLIPELPGFIVTEDDTGWHLCLYANNEILLSLARFDGPVSVGLFLEAVRSCSLRDIRSLH